MSEGAFSGIYSRRVRFSDTDCQGHVFNANYFVYFDDAVTDFLEQAGIPYRPLLLMTEGRYPKIFPFTVALRERVCISKSLPMPWASPLSESWSIHRPRKSR